MPIYEYLCDNCGHQFEAFQKISDEPTSQCPECNTTDVRRLVSATSFRLKGNGWYQTDFKDKPSSSKPTETESTSDSGTSKDTSTKNTSKSETSTTNTEA